MVNKASIAVAPIHKSETETSAHAREGGHPDFSGWIPAYAGMSGLWQLLRCDAHADRAAHACAAETAISHRILGEVLLMIVLGKVELRRVDNFGRDWAVAFRLQCCGEHLF